MSPMENNSPQQKLFPLEYNFSNYNARFYNYFLLSIFAPFLLLALNLTDQDQHHNLHFPYLAVHINSFCNNSIPFSFAILPQHLCSLSTAGVQD